MTIMASAPRRPEDAAPDADGAPSLAVVVMAVGAPPELTAAISSLTTQTPVPEIVVVNSGGGDARARLPAGADGVKIVAHEELLWPGGARNRGIKATRAPFVAFLAADCVAEPGWVAARLVRHEAGARSVASAIVSSAPKNPFAWASNLSLHGRRTPATPAEKALRYGASYDRALFHEFGPFHEGLRIGEDTEFHNRIGRGNKPVWAPEVRTRHADATSLLRALRDQHRRGAIYGMHWPLNRDDGFAGRLRDRFVNLWTTLRASADGRGLLAYAAAPLLLANAASFELGAARGRRRPNLATRHEAKARRSQRAGDLRQAVDEWARAAATASHAARANLGRAEALMRLKRFDEAAQAYQEVALNWPDFAVGLDGLARSAHRAGRWQQALDAWARSEALSPGRPGPAAGRISALVALDRAPEARRLAPLAARYPDDPGALAAMTELAVADQDWARALGLYRDRWTRFRDVEALRQAVAILIGYERLDEADDLLRALRDTDADEVVVLRTQLALMDARQDRAGIAAMLAARPDLLVKRLGLMLAYVSALAVLGRADEALPILRESRIGDRHVLKLAEIGAHVRARRFEEIHKGFSAIWRREGPVNVGVPLLSSMVATAVAAGGPPLARRALDRLPGGAAPADEVARLAALFQRARLDSIEGLLAPVPRAAGGRLEDRVAALLEGSRVRLGVAPNTPEMRECCAAFRMLRGKARPLHPDPSFWVSDAIAVARIIAEAIDERRPFSIIRLGDGEGNLMPYREALRGFEQPDRLATQRTWWGGDRLGDRAGTIIAAFMETIAAADMVGIADLNRVARTMGRHEVASPLGHAKGARGLLTSIDWAVVTADDLTISPRQALTSSHVHQSLAYWGLWDHILRRIPSAVMVTCHPRLAEVLAERHGVACEELHLLPAERKYAPAFGQGDGETHFPDMFERLRETFSRPMHGRVALIAAGFLGKFYCHWIKQSGGVAIDVGSAADFWCGFDTRSLDESTEFRTPEGVPEALLRLAETDPDMATVLGRG